MRKKNITMRASTIIESMIAMVIIMLVFGLSLQIFLSKGGIMTNHAKYKSVVYVENMYASAIAEQNWNEIEIEIGGIVITKTVQPFKESSGLYVLTIEAVEKNSKTNLFKKIELIKKR